MLRQVIVNLFGGLSPLCIPFDSETLVTTQDLKGVITSRTLIPSCEQRLVKLNGRTLDDVTPVFQEGEDFLTLNLKLGILGGKGGFGSMLRAQGGKMASQKTTNFEACRDLNGRRLRTINEAKKLADYLEKEPERQRAKEEKIQKKIKEGMREPPTKKHRFDDTKFLEESREIIDDVKSAVAIALKSKKRETKKSVRSKTTENALSMWDVEMSDYDSSEASDEQDDASSSLSSDNDDIVNVFDSSQEIKEKENFFNNLTAIKDESNGQSLKSKHPADNFGLKVASKGKAVQSSKRKARDEDDQESV
ncbi:hypothetical protein G9A89_021637 [Geosiphon pyriformis]|nr:hypothetical protein G9A89_021637 [Geosiphon pyriformis]